MADEIQTSNAPPGYCTRCGCPSNLCGGHYRDTQREETNLGDALSTKEFPLAPQPSPFKIGSVG